jgi:hypothetical protein
LEAKLAAARLHASKALASYHSAAVELALNNLHLKNCFASL